MHKYVNALLFTALLLPVLLFGFTWSPEVNVSQFPGGRDYAVCNNTRFLALFGDTVYIPWERWVDNDTTPGAARARWTPDNGATWGPEIDLSALFGGAEGHYMSIAVSNGVAHLLAHATDITYYRSTNSGLSWDEKFSEIMLMNSSSLATQGDMIHAVWVSGLLVSTYRYSRSTDNGLNWDTPQDLVTTSSTMPIPSIAVYDDNVYLVYNMGSMLTDTVCFMKSDDGGVNWLPSIVLGTASLFVGGASPCIACQDNYVYVVWNGGTMSSNINFRRSTDRGATWESTQNIGDGNSANLYALGPCLYTAWAGSGGELKFRYSNDYGASWGTEETPSATAKIGYTPGPTIIVTPGPNWDVHIAWTDTRFKASGDTGEIYYIHGTCPCGVKENKFTSPAFSVISTSWGFSVEYELNEPGILRIYNIAGRIAKAQKITHSCEVRMEELPSGVYFLTLKTPTHYLRTKGIYLKHRLH